MDHAYIIKLILAFLAGLFLRGLLSLLLNASSFRQKCNRGKTSASNHSKKKPISMWMGYFLASNDERDDPIYSATPLQDSRNPTNIA
ncbi:MAG: hypothetical protein LBB25_00750 [Holosporaceae bacterium]|jgi:hypothetical protein|nr:hypothetical protein [Holosporaceae bacterium]